MRDRRLLWGIWWTAAFAAMHVYWAVGGTGGLPTDGPPLRDRPVFLAYDLLTVGVLLAAIAVAIGLYRRPTVRLARLVLVGALVSLLRGAVGVVQDLVAVMAGNGVAIDAIWDVWFVIAAALFLSPALHHVRYSGATAAPVVSRR